MNLEKRVRKVLKEQQNKKQYWIPEGCPNLTPPSSDLVRIEPFGNLKVSLPKNKRFVDPLLIDKLEILMTKFDEGATVISAGRTSMGEGARCSQHLVGKAVDIKLDNSSEENILQFIRIASSVGFNGIGVYDSGRNKMSVHLDIRPDKSIWGKDYTSASVPNWAKDTLMSHLKGTSSSPDIASKKDIEINSDLISKIKSKIENKIEELGILNFSEEKVKSFVNKVIAILIDKSNVA